MVNYLTTFTMQWRIHKELPYQCYHSGLLPEIYNYNDKVILITLNVRKNFGDQDPFPCLYLVKYSPHVIREENHSFSFTINGTKNCLLNQCTIKSSSGDIGKDQFQIYNY